MRILLTGSSGRVGAAIAEQLSSSHEVVGLDLVPGKYTHHIGSILNRELLFEIAGTFEAIVHTASLHVPHLNTASRSEFFSTNVTGTELLLEAALAHGIRRMVYSSTTSIYGYAMVPLEKAVWVTEELAPKPRDVYDETKLQAEQLCQAAARGGSLSCVCLRFARCFPEPEPALATFRLYRGVDVRDVAVAHQLGLEASLSEFEVYIISAQTPFQPEDSEQLFHDARGFIHAQHPAIAEIFAARGWPLPHSIDRVYDIGKARAHFGYQPRCNFEEFVRNL